VDKRELAAQGVMLLDREAVESFLTLDEAIDCVAEAYAALYSDGAIQPPVVNLALPDKEGEVDVKTGYLRKDDVVSVKVASGFYRNQELYGLPTGAGAVLLIDADTGFPLALMDGSFITAIRTGAAGAVAAKYLVRPEAKVACILGAGTQGRLQLLALTHALSNLRKVFIYDKHIEAVEAFVDEMGEATGLPVRPVAPNLLEVVKGADVVVTATPCTYPLIWYEWLRPGLHITAIGADGPGKQELDPAILGNAKVVVDSWEQASRIGECQHAVSTGSLKPDGSGIYAEIGAIVAGKHPGRTSAEDITVFDATGVAVQDVAVAAQVYRRAREAGHDQYFKLREL